MRVLLAAFLLIAAMISSGPASAQTQNDVNQAVANAANAAETAAPTANDNTNAPQRNPADGTTNVQKTTDANANAGAGEGNREVEVLPESGEALVQLFVLAVLLESALALLFNWRPFIVSFDGRAVKPIVSFVAALIVVFTFHTDVFAELLRVYGGDLSGAGESVSRVLEAMVLAGGSSGVNTMLRGLGFRALPTAERQREQRPPPDKAWLAVRLHGNAAHQTVLVETADISTAAARAAPQYSTAGTITGSTRSGWRSFFLRDFGRFPTTQGFPVTPGTPYLVRVRQQGAAEGQGAQEITLAPGAIVDLDFNMIPAAPA